MARSRRWMVAGVALVLFVGACGDSDSDESGATEPTATESTQAPAGDGDDGGATEEGTEETSAPSPGSGSGNGSVTLDGDTTEFESARCFLQEQDAAAGGGKILFVAQGFGTNGDGVEVAVDISRFDEDSQFTGDVVSVVIGDPFSGDAQSWDATGDIGTVSVDGDVVSADGLTFNNLDDFAEAPGAFEIRC